jgi:hypothetical protein
MNELNYRKGKVRAGYSCDSGDVRVRGDQRWRTGNLESPSPSRDLLKPDHVIMPAS